MSENEKRCGNCRWFGTLGNFLTQSCEFPKDRLPASFAVVSSDLMSPSDGTDCPAHAPRAQPSDYSPL